MSRSEQKQQTRQRILASAGRGFRKGGFGGAGVDGLAKEAGVTSGAFYSHFGSKAEAFREAMAAGMAELKAGVSQFQAEHGPRWWAEFVRFYLGSKRCCCLEESCALQSLAPEVARADVTTREAFEADLQEVAAIITAGPVSPGAPRSQSAALAALATLAGAVTLARALESPELAEQIASTTEQMLLTP
ncbi:TetR/AcrR family transcriptional regulator [Pseudomonas mangrovi]|jgi:TetR/AcrR family transcriptional repressor of nem operon|uniref:TetR family transcriptional regulator n=1 Tax=Pseudomonas mangrovi TaxID=2161748 RepID=A0A2T5P9H1_9PSED|nr:TetR/AcrR family transcriptional regulator [Pseudomonas mangrovi]PTU74389.1 TetR family transcriptional regulator [Pseudomonas mangrovi]